MKLADGTVLPIPPQRVNRYMAYKDKEMTLGLRPEHLTEIMTRRSRTSRG